MEEFPQIQLRHYSDLRREIRSGDILLCSGSSIFSTLIQKATQSVWSHVAFILRLDVIDRIMVLESVESIGVRAVPLSSYLYDYNGSGKAYPGRLMLARHQEMQAENIEKLSRFAVDLLGFPYGKDEIIRIATRIAMYSVGVSATKEVIPQREFICSEYAYTCFKSIGIDIEFNRAGFIAPCDFANSAKIKPLCYMHTDCEEKTAVA